MPSVGIEDPGLATGVKAAAIKSIGGGTIQSKMQGKAMQSEANV
jgi:hypothetical protein